MRDYYVVRQLPSSGGRKSLVNIAGIDRED